ncbi:MAG: hypothetical protein QXZ44_07280 [Ferroplasma sp.]
MDRQHVEIKKIKGNNYAYLTINLWDKKTKKEIKISRYLGRLNDSNKIEKKIELPEKSYQYGDVALLFYINHDLISNIQKMYRKYWREIITASIITIIGRVPMSYIKGYYRRTFLSCIWPKLKLEPQNLERMIKYISSQKLEFEALEHYDYSTLIMHVEVIIPVYELSNVLKYGNSTVTLDIAFDPVEMRILNVEHLTGTEMIFSRFLNITEEAAKFDGILILESIHYKRANLDLLKKRGKLFIMEVDKENILKILKSYDRGGTLLLSRKFVTLLHKYLYFAGFSRGGLNYYIFDDTSAGEYEFIKIRNSSSIIMAVSNMNLHENLIYQAIHIKKFLYSSISSSKYRIESDRAMIQGKQGLDGYIIFNIIALKFYLSLYKKSALTSPGRHKHIDSVMIELSTVNIFMIKSRLYLPNVSRTLLKDISEITEDSPGLIFDNSFYSLLKEKMN